MYRRTPFSKLLLGSAVLFCAFLFLLPRSVFANAGLTEECRNMYASAANGGPVFCNAGAACLKTAEPNSNGVGETQMLNGAPKEMCFPYRNSVLCKCESGQQCVIVQSAYDLSKYDWRCLDTINIPNEKKAGDQCKKSADCLTVGQGGVNTQCVWVYPIGSQASMETISSGNKPGTYGDYVAAQGWLYYHSRCIDKSKLPPAVLEPAGATPGGGGTCSVNGGCADGKSCVDNVYAEGTHVSERYICYDNGYITDAGCSGKAVGDDCGEGKKCVNILQAATNPILKCAATAHLPFGPNAPGAKGCLTNADCTKGSGDKYCVYNPTLAVKQCMSQTMIYSQMEPVPTIDQCEIKDGGKCVEGKETVCTKYYPEAGKEFNVCISSQALTTGAATATEKPIELAPERLERYAPVLEITIPDLHFASSITGQAVSGGHVYVIPYIANYINAVYKYLLGAGALLAIVLLMWGGFQWMVSAGNATTVNSAKTTMLQASLGLLLLFGAFTILYIINPDLTTLTPLRIFAPKQEQFQYDFGPNTLTTADNADLQGGDAGGGGKYSFKYFQNCPVPLSNPVAFADDSQKKPGDIRKNVPRRVEFHAAVMSKNLITGSPVERAIKSFEAAAQCQIQYENCGVVTTNIYALADSKKDEKELACLKNADTGHKYGKGDPGFCNFLGNGFGKKMVHDAFSKATAILKDKFKCKNTGCGEGQVSFNGQCVNTATAAQKLRELLTAAGGWSADWTKELQPGDYYAIANWNPTCTHSAMFLGWANQSSLQAYVEKGDAFSFVRSGKPTDFSDKVIIQISRPQ